MDDVIKRCCMCKKLITAKSPKSGQTFDGMLKGANDQIVAKADYKDLHADCAERLKYLLENGFKSRRGPKKTVAVKLEPKPAPEPGTAPLPLVEPGGEEQPVEAKEIEDAEEPPDKDADATPDAREGVFKEICKIHESLCLTERTRLFHEVMEELGVAKVSEVGGLGLLDMQHFLERLREKTEEGE